MPLTDHVALVSLTRDIPTRLVLQAAAAMQKQITRDFTPYWGLRVTVDAFEDLESVPTDYHPIVIFGASDELVSKLEYAVGEERTAEIVDDFERGRLTGLHMNSFTRQPFALVAANDTWSVTLSHEALEMITDPFGNRLVAAAHPFDPRRRVRYLLEVCDPCQAVWYPVNGVPVSDFYCPRYFDPVLPDRDRYSFTGAIERPLQILEGGYLTWIDPGDSGALSPRSGGRGRDPAGGSRRSEVQHRRTADDRRHESADPAAVPAHAAAGQHRLRRVRGRRRRRGGLARHEPARGPGRPLAGRRGRPRRAAPAPETPDAGADRTRRPPRAAPAGRRRRAAARASAPGSGRCSRRACRAAARPPRS